jgi:hypothetical protein
MSRSGRQAAPSRRKPILGAASLARPSEHEPASRSPPTATPTNPTPLSESYLHHKPRPIMDLCVSLLQLCVLWPARTRRSRAQGLAPGLRRPGHHTAGALLHELVLARAWAED